MATTGGKIIWDLEADNSNLKAGLSEARNEADKTAVKFSTMSKDIGNSISGFGQKMSLLVTAPVIAAGGAAVKSAADYEQLTVAFTTMLGSADKAKQLLSDLTDFASKTPFRQDEVNQAAKSLLAYGVAGGDVAKTLRAIGDVSAGVNVPIAEMADIFGKMRSQGVIMTDDLNQLAGRGIPILDFLAKKYGVTTLEIRDMASKSKISFTDIEEAFTSMSGKGGQFFDLMNKQSGTTAGKFSTLQDNISNLAREIGIGLLPIANQIIDTLASWVDSFSKLDPGIKAAIFGTVGFVAILGPLLVILGSVIGAIGTISAAFVGVPFIPIIAGFAAVIGIGYALVNAMGGMDNVTKGLSKTFNQLVDIYNQFVKPALERLFGTIANELIPSVKKLFDQISPLLIPILKTLASVITASVVVAFNIIVGAMTTAISTISTVISIISAMIDVIKGIKGAVTSAVGGIADTITKPFKDAFNWIIDNARKVYDALKDLSPYTKHSPSLVEQIQSGVREIKSQYGKLNDIALPSLKYQDVVGAGTAEKTTSNVTNNRNNPVTVNIGQVNDTGDIDMLARELGFRLSII